MLRLRIAQVSGAMAFCSQLRSPPQGGASCSASGGEGKPEEEKSEEEKNLRGEFHASAGADRRRYTRRAGTDGAERNSAKNEAAQEQCFCFRGRETAARKKEEERKRDNQD